jgi:hypothetical protein
VIPAGINATRTVTGNLKVLLDDSAGRHGLRPATDLAWWLRIDPRDLPVS